MRIHRNIELLRKISKEITWEDDLPQPIIYIVGPRKDWKGLCTQYSDGNYTIHISAFNRTYYGTQYKRCLFEIIETLAHELAHLKIWRHGKKHTAYTEELRIRITQKHMEVKR